jgi:hypothetical protein
MRIRVGNVQKFPGVTTKQPPVIRTPAPPPRKSRHDGVETAFDQVRRV